MITLDELLELWKADIESVPIPDLLSVEDALTMWEAGR